MEKTEGQGNNAITLPLYPSIYDNDDGGVAAMRQGCISRAK
jgi:hypothetical protein